MLDERLLLPAPLSGGQNRDVVLSCTATLGRNLEDALFPNRASITEALETRGRIMSAISTVAPSRIEVLVEELEAADALLLAERGWAESAASNDPGRALAVLDSPSTVLAVNDVDHLRIVCVVSGDDSASALSRARELDVALDAELGWAATVDLGYLSARMEEGGSALNLSALVFIPGIIAAGVLDRVAGGLLSSGIEPRVLSMGRDTDTSEVSAEGQTSPYVGLSSQAPRGVAEEDFLADFQSALAGLIDGERRTRDRLLAARRIELEDASWRAAAILAGARLLPEGEARRLIADLRAGVSYEVAPAASPPQSDPYAALDRARSIIGSGQLRVLARRRGSSPDVRPLDALRAELVREVLPRYDIV